MTQENTNIPIATVNSATNISSNNHNPLFPYQEPNGTVHTGLYALDYPVRENKSLYLGESYHFDALIQQILHGQITDNIFLIKSPMGSGKSHTIEYLSKQYSNQNIGVVQMLIYKKSLEDYEKYYNHHLMQDFLTQGGKPDAQLQNRVYPVLSKASVKRNDGTLGNYNKKILLTYTKPFYDVYAEGLITDGLIRRTQANQTMTNRELVINYMTDKIVLVDEADYLVNIIHAFANSPQFRESTLSKEERTGLLIEAAKTFYADIACYATALLLFTATTTEEFLEILPEEKTTIDPSAWLPDGFRMKSVPLQAITFVPYYERKVNGNRLSDTIIHKIIHAEPWDKVLMFFPNIQKQDYNCLPKGKRVLIICPLNKYKNGAIEDLGITALDENIRILPVVDTQEDLEDGQTFDGNLPNLYNTLTDAAIRDYDIILITGSNARAANILAQYNKVLVITEAPLKAEVIQAMGRFRNSHVHTYILERKITNHDDGEVAIDTKHKRFNKVYLDTQTVELANEYILKITNGVLISRIYDLDFTVKSSMLDTVIQADMNYCHENFEFKLADIPEAIRKTHYLKKDFADKKGGKVLAFLEAHKALSYTELLKKWVELYPDDRPVSKPTLIKYRKQVSGNA